MNSLYAEGDIVMLKEDLEADEYYAYEDGHGELYFDPAMLIYRGLEVTITRVGFLTGNEDIVYKIKDDKGLWYWSAGMIEGLVEPPVDMSCDFGCLM